MQDLASGTVTPAHFRVACSAVSMHFKHSSPHQDPQKQGHLQWSAPNSADDRKHRAQGRLMLVLEVTHAVKVELSRPLNTLKLLLPHSARYFGKVPREFPPPSLDIIVSSSALQPTDRDTSCCSLLRAARRYLGMSAAPTKASAAVV